jgi:hypothetical protein
MSPCHWIKMPDGTVAHLNMAKQRTKRCHKCGRASTKLCDGVVSPPEQITHKKTCDKPLCDNCAHHVPGKDLDYCGEHADKLGVSLIL